MIRHEIRMEPRPAAVERVRALRARAYHDDDKPGQRRPVKASLRPDGTLELLVYGDIGESWWDDSGITVKSIKEQIDAAGAHTGYAVRINSPGGDAFEGIAIHNLLRSQGKPIQVYIDGIAASAASVVAMCGDTIQMASSSMMMIHNAATITYGDAAELREVADILEKITTSMAQVYVDRTGLTIEEIQARLDAETWMSAQECLDQGFCTEVAQRSAAAGDEEEEEEEEALALARVSLAPHAYRNVPERLRAPDLGAAPPTPRLPDAEQRRRWELRLRLAQQ